VNSASVPVFRNPGGDESERLIAIEFINPNFPRGLFNDLCLVLGLD